MKQRKLSDRTALGRCAVSVVASSALLTGCATMTSIAPSAAVVSQSGTMKGRVHGGSQPVAGATVSLYFAGQSGLRSTATPQSLAATTITAADGTFSFIKDTPGSSHDGTTSTYACPATGGPPLVYVIAKGGNTQDATSGYNNTASAFLAALGFCSDINASTIVNMSEVTTVATLAAVQQYMDPVTESIGADGIGIAYNGLSNAFKLAGSTLVDLSTGTARGASSQTGVGVTVTTTPEVAKINSIANIIAACVNNATAAATPCTTLFANATPPSLATTGPIPSTTSGSLPPATDVIQAALYMLTNPTDGSTANLANLYNLPAPVGAPYQPTLTAVPTDWTVGVSYASSGTCTGGGPFLQNSNQLSIDVSGNIFISNGAGNLAELSPSGAPIACQSLPPSGSAGSTIDKNGNVWVASYSTNAIYRYSPSDSSVLTFNTPFAPIGLTADGAGNIFYTTFQSANSTAGLYVIPNASSLTAGADFSASAPISTTIGAQAFQLMPDPSGAVWVSSFQGFVSKVSADTATPGSYITTAVTVPSASYGIAVTSASNLFTASNTSNQLTYLTGSGTTYNVASGFPTVAGAAGVSSPTGITLDGASNVWIANQAGNAVSEISAAGVSLSPDATGFRKSTSYLTAGRSIVVDQSGNVFIGQDNSATLTEIIGAGVPVYQPFALGLSNGRFQLIP